LSARQVVATRVWLLLLSGYLSTFSLFFSGTCSWSCSQPLAPPVPLLLHSFFHLSSEIALCTPLHPWYLAISLQPAPLGVCREFGGSFCCSLSSTFPLKLPCTPLHPWYLATFLCQAGAGAGAGLDSLRRHLIFCVYCRLRRTTSISASASA